MPGCSYPPSELSLGAYQGVTDHPKVRLGWIMMPEAPWMAHGAQTLGAEALGNEVVPSIKTPIPKGLRYLAKEDSNARGRCIRT